MKCSAITVRPNWPIYATYI